MARDEQAAPQPTGGSLTAEQIERQGFARVRKGVDEQQVRGFLSRVAAEYRMLTRRIAGLEERLRHPRMPSEQQLVDLVSDEVARTLRSAQESAEEVTSRARDRAAEVERNATEEAQRFRAQQLEQATQDARAIIEAARERGREMVAEARAFRERVISDLNRRRDLLRNYIEQVRADRDRFADTYRAVREAVTDARDELARFESGQPFQGVPVDAGPIPALPPEPTVPETPAAPATPERQPRWPAASSPTPTQADAHARSGQRQAQAPRAVGIGLGELPGRTEPVPPLAPASREPQPGPETEAEAAPRPHAEPAPEADQAREPEVEPEREREREPETAATPQPAAEPAPAEPDAAAAEPAPEAATPAPEPARTEPEAAAVSPTLDLESEPALAPQPEAETAAPATPGVDVDSLFERIRTGGAQAAAAPTGNGEEELGNEAPTTAGPVTEIDTEDAELLRQRDELLTSVAHDLIRRCKRVLQNEQNEVLDALRRHRGRLTPDKLLPPIAEQLAGWTDVMTPALDEAYVAARAATSSATQDSPVFSAPKRVVTGLVEVVVTPLRERLLATVGETLSEDPDTDGDVIAKRIGAQYREWRGQELDGRIGDVLAAAYARGVYDATPEGSRLRWVPAQKGQCPDADDNALEPTARGDRFPTGQQFPPAHPGCRCVLAVVREP
jgi:hypothetical protein